MRFYYARAWLHRVQQKQTRDDAYLPFRRKKTPVLVWFILRHVRFTIRSSALRTIYFQPPWFLVRSILLFPALFLLVLCGTSFVRRFSPALLDSKNLITRILSWASEDLGQQVHAFIFLEIPGLLGFTLLVPSVHRPRWRRTPQNEDVAGAWYGTSGFDLISRGTSRRRFTSFRVIAEAKI